MTFKLKITLLGEASVGKTSLVYRFIDNRFQENYKSTLGVALLKKDFEIEEYGEVSTQIWDLGGQEAFENLRKLYYKGANGALVIFDMTNKNSFDKVSNWLESFKDSQGNLPVVLIGNKADLTDEIKVTEEEARQFAGKNNMKFIITSAKTGNNVEESFRELTKDILFKFQQEN